MHMPAAASHATPADLRDALGCTADRLLRNEQISLDGGLQLYRKTVSDEQAGSVETPPSGRGILLGVSLADGHSRRIVHAHHATTHHFGCGSIYVRDFNERYRADMKSGFDFLLVEFPYAALEQDADRAVPLGLGAPNRLTGVRDEVLHHLALALLPALAHPQAASRLFLDHVTGAMAAHVLARCEGQRTDPPRRRRLLPRTLELRAKEMLAARLDGDLSAQEIADACGMSRSYFIHAFRETTGQTPHQWLVAQRLARARALLAKPTLTLADIAATCGFADQSHFSRVFTQHMGLPPGRWRRTYRH